MYIIAHAKLLKTIMNILVFASCDYLMLFLISDDISENRSFVLFPEC